MKKDVQGQITNEFITIITREDLTPGYKVVQSAHAIANFAIEHENQFKQWQQTSNYLCCLETSKLKIDRIISKLDLLRIKYSVFFEPDINDMTAIAIQSISRDLHKKLFKNLKLTLL